VIRARALVRGARVGVLAPAARVDAARLESAEASVRALGFEPVRVGDPTAACGYFAGDDARRRAELEAAIRDGTLRALLCARGGYGCHRFADRLDPAVFARAARPLVGYSDVTTLLLWQWRRAGLTGVHGPMLEREGPQWRDSLERLFELLQGAVPPPMEGRGLVGGRAEGRLVGGSLTLVAASLGTPWEVDTRGAILLLEDVNEAPLRIDRMLQSLRAAGKLAECAGIGLGAMVGCEDERFPDWSAESVVEEVARAAGVPLVAGLPFGHVDDNRAWTLGAAARLDAERGRVEQVESGLAQS